MRFVVANISTNERIKQKLICNATKTDNGYREDLDWECDEEALAKMMEDIRIQTSSFEEENILEILKEFTGSSLFQKINNLTKKNKYIESINKNVNSGYEKFMIDKLNIESVKSNYTIDNIDFDNILNKLGFKKIVQNISSVDNTNKILKEIKNVMILNNNKTSGQKGAGGDDRRLYIKEMCKTQIALFRELQSIINKIVKSD